jgi:hypothetical protein|tara:strand:- start:565 stop:879 length:315 start_codon:yes stop_codon:yes gene_type:complete
VHSIDVTSGAVRVAVAGIVVGVGTNVGVDVGVAVASGKGVGVAVATGTGVGVAVGSGIGVGVMPAGTGCTNLDCVLDSTVQARIRRSKDIANRYLLIKNFVVGY